MPKAIQCPFFQYEAGSRYLCEGAEIQFRDRDTRGAMLCAYCAGDWRSCPIAQALARKYE